MDAGAQAVGPHSVAAQAPLRESLRVLSFELAAAEQRERERIARGLHDELGQLLAVARMKVQALRPLLPPAGLGELDELTALLAQASQAARTATFELSSPALQLGLHEALLELAGQLSRGEGLTVRVEGQMPPLDGPPPVLAVLYRVLRELALNVQRHARAQRAWIRLGQADGQLVISITDDGIGITPEDLARGVRPEGGFGLVSARAQMLALGGDLVVESAAGAGTVATLTLPLPPGDTA